MSTTFRLCRVTKAMLSAFILALALASSSSYALNLADQPLYLAKNEPPLVMLVMGRDNQLYFEAYNDASDLNGDGILDYVYKPAEIDYYGYFDSFKCYTYDGSKFVPSSRTTAAALKKCTGASEWSGDWLNYNTMTRMDTLRKVLYGGNRSTDTGGAGGQTILERAYVPQDIHTWAKKYESIAVDGYNIQDYTPLGMPSSGQRHLFGNVTLNSPTNPPLLRVLPNSSFQPWEWASIELPVLGDQCARAGNQRYNCTAGRVDYTVRIKVCDKNLPELNCKSYAGTTLKPTGLLHKYGEGNGMYFGLISGSFIRNTQGGVLRKAMGSIDAEINADGTYKSNGIISSINSFRIAGFTSSSYFYGNYNTSSVTDSCGWIQSRPMLGGECQDWGNPLGEMVYEAVRYFAGKGAATPSFSYNRSDSKLRDNQLGLPLANWNNPYAAGGYATCSKPYVLLINDIYPSFDSDSVPGSKFCPQENNMTYPCASFSGDLSGLDVEAEGQRIWNHEFGTGTTKSVFIGQAGSTYNNAPTPKSATTLGNLRGLAPLTPTFQGSYTTAEIAHWAKRTDLNAASGDQSLSTFSVALAAPLPEIKIAIGTDSVSFIPFGKTVYGGVSPAPNQFQPTDAVVDFYITSVKNTWRKTINGSLLTCLTASSIDFATYSNDCNSGVNGGRPYYKFGVNFNDSEVGGDNDMDAIVNYEVFLNANNTISVNLTSSYAAGGNTQHLGYVVSGGIETNASGTPISGASNSLYLNVRDNDNSPEVDYYLDTPNIAGSLPLNSLRYFKANPSATTATLLKDPLWFAAKYGGFTDSGNLNNLPDTIPAVAATGNTPATPYSSEWDADADGVPDNYFLVINPLKLEQQLDKALENIQITAGSASALTANSQSYKSGQLLYQAKFSSDGWGGELIAYSVAIDGTLTPTPWAAHQYLSTQQATSSRVILTYDKDRTGTDANGRPLRGIPFKWSSMTTAGTLQTALNTTAGGAADALGATRVSHLRGELVPGMRIRPLIPGTATRNLLGDIVNSGLQYVGAPAFSYLEPAYKAFYTANQNRKAMLYAGANDGMLHGFDANTSAELLAYIPYALYGGSRLSKLTATDYGMSSNPHGYYVDGTPTIGDVCGGSCAAGSDWKTILVGGLNRGGQGIYALDITDPANFTEGNAANTVLWEFTDEMDNLPITSPSPSPFDFTDDATTRYGLGYTYSQPSIVRICTQRDASSTTEPKYCPTTNRKWVVVFGNGYNNAAAGNTSASGHAMLYVLDALTGKLLTKISTKTGDTSNGGSNGLATVTPVDLDGDTVADYVYAGDMNGNLWKFDLSDDKPALWGVAYGTAAAPAPLYTAKSGTGTLQPITTPPEIAFHPLGGTMVLFGTGKYMEAVIDPVSTSQQTFYGIRDNGKIVPSPDRSNLQKQSIDSKENTTSIGELSAGSKTAVDWASKSGWYIDLPEIRERVVYEPKLYGKVLYFPSLAPNPAVCSYGGDSWDYFVNYLTGGALDVSPFIGVTQVSLASGSKGVAVRRQSQVGMSPTGTLITKGDGQGLFFKTGSKDAPPEGFGTNFGSPVTRRVAWRELTAD